MVILFIMSSKYSKPLKPSSRKNIDELKPFCDEWFDKSSSIWMKNKVYLPSKGLTLYYTTSDSPLTVNEWKTHTPKHPNVEKWCKCGYVSPDGTICTNNGIIYQDEVAIRRTEYDYEKYTEPRFCAAHAHLLQKEIQRRTRELKTIIEERRKLSKFPVPVSLPVQ